MNDNNSIEKSKKNDERQSIYAQPWSEKSFEVETQGKPKGDIKHVFKICRGPNCGKKLSDVLHNELSRRFADRPDVHVSYCYCLGQCTRGNNVVINGCVLNYVTVQGLDHILRKHIYVKDELAKAGLTPDELDTILFGTGI